MKQIIDGLRYDTETATLITNRLSIGAPRDHGHIRAALYRTPRGRYFLAGSGGPASIFAEYMGNQSYSGGSGIRPLSEDDALRWCEEYDQDAAERHFGARVQPA